MNDHYPTKEHENAAKKIVSIFSKDKRVMCILLTCSCARKKATKDSCLDICLIVKNKKHIKSLNEKFSRIYPRTKEFVRLNKVGKYSHIDLDVTDGRIDPKERGWTSGPDEYELKIGNFLFYPKVLFDRGNYFASLRKKYLPYYPEKLRKKRLKEVKAYLNNNIEHVEPYVKRKLYFQAFSRLYNASKEFLQALFIKNRAYPISYDKWIKEQLVEILKKPKLYREFVGLYEIKKLESNELIKKAEKLKKMVKEYL